MRGSGALSFGLRERKRYTDPAKRYFARFGSPLRRAGAAAIDWTLCYVLFVVVAIPLGAVEALGSLSEREGDLGGTPGHILVIVAQLLTVAPIVAYFGLLLPTSQTFGMRLVDLHAVSVRTGRAPSYPVSFIRGVVSLVMAAAVYAVFLSETSFEKPSHLDDASRHALDASYVVAGVACVSALLMIVTPSHRSLVDRLFGTAVLDELEGVTPRIGPWGPLDAFDLSHGRR